MCGLEVPTDYNGHVPYSDFQQEVCKVVPL